ncbi:hypothetical protein EV282_3511 [Fictibacillus sp. BK138]|nr:hypothetical protein EV282_3511 [Fictibacillus sp. BK138]
MRDSCGISGTGETPKGAKRQEARRPPRGKRATWSGNQPLSSSNKVYESALYYVVSIIITINWMNLAMTIIDLFWLKLNVYD